MNKWAVFFALAMIVNIAHSQVTELTWVIKYSAKDTMLLENFKQRIFDNPERCLINAQDMVFIVKELSVGSHIYRVERWLDFKYEERYLEMRLCDSVPEILARVIERNLIEEWQDDNPERVHFLLKIWITDSLIVRRAGLEIKSTDPSLITEVNRFCQINYPYLTLLLYGNKIIILNISDRDKDQLVKQLSMSPLRMQR